jgi:hypothetical protein
MFVIISEGGRQFRTIGFRWQDMQVGQLSKPYLGYGILPLFHNVNII